MRGEEIRRARVAAGLSQARVAALAGVPRSQVQILERGGNVTLKTLEKVLAALNLSLAVVTPAELEILCGGELASALEVFRRWGESCSGDRRSLRGETLSG